jgi:outer membrane protein OmpA-like peptidoglycan-associated protein
VACLLLTFAMWSGVRAAPATDPVPLARGLVFTTTSRAGLAASTGTAPVADTEIVYSVVGSDDDRISFRFSVDAPEDAAASKLLDRVPRSFDRSVRREDLRSAARLTVLMSSRDPVLSPGQTFAGTSSAVLQRLRGSGSVGFILGVNEPEQGLAALANIGEGARSAANANANANGSGSTAFVASGVAALLSSLTVARHYYRGALERVGTGDEPFPVLLDGRRTTLPALHVRGELTFGERKITPQLWWLDDANNPLTLKWSIEDVYETVTRIDRPAGVRVRDVEQALTGKSCRTELSGVYFTTASAHVLDASLPALERFASLLREHPDWRVTIEGHTDNIGTGEYNLDLSTRRAAAVRLALMQQYGISADRLQTKGYGLTRPVESNATDEGRAHNRRVEVSRNCVSQA